MPAEQVAKFGKGCRQSVLQGSHTVRALFESGPGLLWLSEGKDGWQRLVRKAFEMGLGRGLLRIPFGMVIRGCRDFAFIRHSLAATLKEWKKPKSAAWPKRLHATHHGGGHVHLLVLAVSAKGVVEVSL